MTEPATKEIKVDPEVAYRSGLCKRCGPTQPSPWERGALFWAQAVFALLIAIVVALMLVAIFLCAQYLAKPQNRTRHRNRRRMAN